MHALGSHSMGILSRLFGPKSSPTAGGNQQAVLIHLDGTSPPAEIYAQHDLATLEERLVAILERGAQGEYDGHEFGPTETMLYLYGPKAERLFSDIEPVLREYPLCRNARVIFR